MVNTIKEISPANKMRNILENSLGKLVLKRDKVFKDFYVNNYLEFTDNYIKQLREVGLSVRKSFLKETTSIQNKIDDIEETLGDLW